MAASLSGVFNVQEFTDLGTLLVGGRLYTYEPNTTTMKVAYTDASGLIPQTYTNDGLGGQYIALNARGELPAGLFLSSGGYDLALKSAAGATLWTRRASGAASDILEALLGGAGAGMIGFTQAGAGAVDRTVQQELRSSVRVEQFGAVLNGVTSDASALANANAQAALVGKPLNISGVMHIPTPVTITVPIVDTMAQLFSTSSNVTINNGLPVRPEWFGLTTGCIMRAVNSLPGIGGGVQLANRRYPPSYNTFNGAKGSNGTGVAGVDYLAKPGVRIIGTGMPAVADDGESLIDGTGSIIDGPFYCHANRLQAVGFGVDSGKGVCDARYGGQAQDGFATVQINQAAPVFWKGGYYDQIRGLCYASSSPYHAMLIEAGDQFEIGSIYGQRGIHGVVIKSNNWRAVLFDGFDCDDNPVILKSHAYAPCNLGTVDTIRGAKSLLVAVRIQAFDAVMGGITIGQILAQDAPVGVQTDGGAVMSSSLIGRVQTHGCAKGIRRVNSTVGVGIGQAVINNASGASFEDVSGSTAMFTFGKLESLLCGGVFTNSQLTIDEYLSTSTTGYDINYTSTTARVLLGTTRRTAPAQPSITNLNPALSAGWANFGGTRSIFDVQLDSYGYRLKGLLTPGAVNSAICTLPANMRPAQDVLLTSGGLNSGAMVPIFIEVLTTGIVKVANHNLVTIPSGVNLDGLLIPGSYN